MRLKLSKAPRLPAPSPAYSSDMIDQFQSSLRLYFNEIDSLFASILGPNGGQYVDCPNGLFFSTVDQTIAVINTGYPIEFPTTYLSNAVYINAGTDSRIYVSVSGVYNFQFSGQLRSNSGSAKQVYIWIVRDGTPIGYSTHQYTVSGGNTHLNISWNFDIDLQAGQYIELQWSSDSTDITLEAHAATAPHPGIPSAVMAVNFVAPLPDTLPTPP